MNLKKCPKACVVRDIEYAYGKYVPKYKLMCVDQLDWSDETAILYDAQTDHYYDVGFKDIEVIAYVGDYMDGGHAYEGDIQKVYNNENILTYAFEPYLDDMRYAYYQDLLTGEGCLSGWVLSRKSIVSEYLETKNKKSDLIITIPAPELDKTYITI